MGPTSASRSSNSSSMNRYSWFMMSLTALKRGVSIIAWANWPSDRGSLPLVDVFSAREGSDGDDVCGVADLVCDIVDGDGVLSK